MKPIMPRAAAHFRAVSTFHFPYAVACASCHAAPTRETSRRAAALLSEAF
jgi:hypothetical protein